MKTRNLLPKPRSYSHPPTVLRTWGDLDLAFDAVDPVTQMRSDITVAGSADEYDSEMAYYCSRYETMRPPANYARKRLYKKDWNEIESECWRRGWEPLWAYDDPKHGELIVNFANSNSPEIRWFKGVGWALVRQVLDVRTEFDLSLVGDMDAEEKWHTAERDKAWADKDWKRYINLSVWLLAR